MTHSDVQAIGWILVRDMCAETGRRLLGLPARVPAAALRRLGDAWRALQAIRAAESSAWPALGVPLGRPLPRAVERAVEAFAAEMFAAWPERYGATALRRRLFDDAAISALGLVAAMATAHAAAFDPALATLGLFWLCAALCGMIGTLQVLRLYLVVRGRENHPQP
jgi:hypothetical protein